MNPFKSKIKCSQCGKNYRRKLEKGVYKFICGGYSKNIGCKERIVIFEDELRRLINKRYERELSDEEIVSILDHIKVENKYYMEIHFSDNNNPIILNENVIQL